MNSLAKVGGRNWWLTPLDETFNDLFDTWKDNVSPLKKLIPAVDIHEENNNIILSTELPGMKIEDINIEIKNNFLIISGEKKKEETSERKNFFRLERSYGKFERSFKIPDFINEEEIKASFKNGVLTMVIPKKSSSPPEEIKKIDIKSE